MNRIGRTTRLLEHARSNLLNSLNTIIMCADKDAMLYMVGMFERMITVNTTKEPGRVFCTLGESSVEFRVMRINDAKYMLDSDKQNSTIETLFDHFAIETHFQFVLKELHRFD